MSRGPGPLQRHIRDVLEDADDQKLSLRELRRRLGEPDRSNLRRAIRGLLERGIVQESCTGEDPGLELAEFGLFGYIGTSSRLDSSRDRSARATAGRSRRMRTVKKRPRAGHRSPGVGRTRSQGWVRYEHRFARRRPLGGTQRLVLQVLRESAEPIKSGLPVTVVKALVGADRSNARRAIRTLLLRGLIEESEDGRRIRLTPLGAIAHSMLP
jgi:predicted transcriptional regulator